jgi:hypothetical protein
MIDLIAFLSTLGMILGIAYVGIRFRLFKEEYGYDETEETRVANTEDDLVQRDDWSK